MNNSFPAALCALLALAACVRSPEKPPSIILVTVDTLRWDYLDTYGYPEPGTTPATSFLAANGTVFGTAVSTAGTTIPSHASMLTGVYARAHGARSNFHGMYEGVPTVTQSLREAGYQTGAFVSNQFLIKIGGLGPGFDATNTPFRDSRRGGRPQPGAKTVDQAIEWLATLDADRPLFLWLHLWEPHGPYDATAWSRARLGGYDGFLKDGVTLEHTRHRVADIVADPAHVEAMRTHYAGEVNLADRHLGRLLDDLEARGRLADSIVIFTADHGQALAEGGRMGHGPIFWETVLRVPLIIADFRTAQAARDDTRVGTIDIAPTLAAAAGLEIPPHYLGRTLLSHDDLEEDVPYFAEVALRTSTDRNWERVKEDTFYDPAALAVYAGDVKMTFRNGVYQLFQTGPGIRVADELDPDRNQVIADYLQGLIDTFQKLELDLTSGVVSDEDLEELKGLGYVQ